MRVCVCLSTLCNINRVRIPFRFLHSFSLSLSLRIFLFFSFIFLSHIYYRHSPVFTSFDHLNQLRIIQAHFPTFYLQTNYIFVNPFQLRLLLHFHSTCYQASLKDFAPQINLSLLFANVTL